VIRLASLPLLGLAACEDGTQVVSFALATARSSSTLLAGRN